MRRIVIADASPMFRDAAAHLISSLPGYTLAGTSTTSQQTLSLVESAGPDILLVDLGTVCGLETVRRVKAAARPPRVVAMTHTPQAAAAAARGRGRSHRQGTLRRRPAGRASAPLSVAVGKHGHFLLGLPVALLRCADSLLVSGERFPRIDLGQRFAERLQGPE